MNDTSAVLKLFGWAVLLIGVIGGLGGAFLGGGVPYVLGALLAAGICCALLEGLGEIIRLLDQQVTSSQRLEEALEQLLHGEEQPAPGPHTCAKCGTQLPPGGKTCPTCHHVNE